ncbi:MAG: UDP-N-acetylmuramate dehydrogenase [Bacteroidetes bacterium]|nr:UDP-N-acetylmuramate dehydrogenase [Bacteroidota bacterium]
MSLPPIQRQVSLRPYHTFGTDAFASALAVADQPETLWALWNHPEFRDRPRMLLGGGSNVLFVRDFDGLVLLNRLGGLAEVDSDGSHVLLRAGAGVLWHHMVHYAVERGWGGLENLSLIPGLCGAAPMQNIGAYGAELKDVFHELEALDLQSGEVLRFDRQACQFGYRESVFKRQAAGHYAILSLTVRLALRPTLNVTYGAIQDTLKQMGIVEPSVSDVSKAVINIRQSKLPDPAVLGNAGSFFKNPEVGAAQAAELADRFPGMPQYPGGEGMIKLAAGWLIEQCGWKGKRLGNTGAHAQQALVLVNYGGATGAEIWQLACDIREAVLQQFGVTLVPEVNRVG